MEITKTTKEQIEVTYQVVDGDLTYMDSLVFPLKEYDEKEAEKQITDKFNAWKEYVQTPTVPPTKEEIDAKIKTLSGISDAF